MRARDLMQPARVLDPEDDAGELIRAFEDPEVRAVAVVNRLGERVGVLSDEDMLQALLPPYVLDDESLAGVLAENAAAECRRRLEGKRVKDIVDAARRPHPTIGPDATLIEVAASLARTGDPAVLVTEGEEVLGVVTVDVLLPALLRPRRR